MPTYKITVDDKTYKVTAPDEETAFAALDMNPEEEDLTTWSEDVQGFGTKILDGLLLGFGEEAAAGMRAGLDVGVAALFGEDASLYGGDFSKAYENLVADQRDVEERFEKQNPGVALGTEVASGLLTGIGTGGLALKGAQAVKGAAGTTRATNALATGAMGAVEGATYALGENEGTLEERVEDLDMSDALIVGLGVAAGALGGSLTRGTAAESRTIGELSDEAVTRLGTAAKSTALKAKDVSEDIGNVAYKATEAVSPSLAKAGKETIHQISDVASEAATSMRPAFKEVADKFDKLFQPVKDYAAKRVGAQFGARLNRGAIQGQRVINKVDDLFQKNNMFEIREAIDVSPRAKAAMSDYANPLLTPKQRGVALRAIKEELNDPKLFNSYRKFVAEQEDILNDISQGVQNVKRSRGYMSIAADKKSKKDLATQSLEAEREAAERSGRLSTGDASAKDKTKLARLSEDGTGLSKFGEESAVVNPIDSHHYWMRSHAQLNEMNKILGIRGARTEEELAEIARGGFFGKQLKEKLSKMGYSDKRAEDAVEIYNQVVWGSQRSMAKELQAIRNVGYASAIGNPYGAALQFHDIFNSAWANGNRETLEALAKKNGFDISVEDVGVAKQIHSEIVNGAKKADGSFTESALADWAASRSQKLVDWAMGASGFRQMDGWSKGKIMSASLGKEFNEVGADPTAWRKKWRNTFDKDELVELEAALKAKDTSNDLVKQLALLNLSDLQPISAASSSLMQLSVPNARILYMLKGFAMTQLQLIRKRIGAELKQGNRKEALKDMLAYFLISGGGYGVVNETRQLAKLESPDYGNVPAMAFYQMMSIPTMGAFGGNQYGAHLFQQNPFEAMVTNFVPVVPVAEGVGKDLSQLVSNGEITPDKTLETMPMIGPIARGVFDKLESGGEKE